MQRIPETLNNSKYVCCCRNSLNQTAKPALRVHPFRVNYTFQLAVQESVDRPRPRRP
jgi:hypothetical protein